jgi:hypothetical protein
MVNKKWNKKLPCINNSFNVYNLILNEMNMYEFTNTFKEGVNQKLYILYVGDQQLIDDV